MSLVTSEFLAGSRSFSLFDSRCKDPNLIAAAFSARRLWSLNVAGLLRSTAKRARGRRFQSECPPSYHIWMIWLARAGCCTVAPLWRPHAPASGHDFMPPSANIHRWAAVSVPRPSARSAWQAVRVPCSGEADAAATSAPHVAASASNWIKAVPHVPPAAFKSAIRWGEGGYFYPTSFQALIELQGLALGGPGVWAFARASWKGWKTRVRFLVQPVRVRGGKCRIRMLGPHPGRRSERSVGASACCLRCGHGAAWLAGQERTGQTRCLMPWQRTYSFFMGPLLGVRDSREHVQRCEHRQPSLSAALSECFLLRGAWFGALHAAAMGGSGVRAQSASGAAVCLVGAVVCSMVSGRLAQPQDDFLFSCSAVAALLSRRSCSYQYALAFLLRLLRLYVSPPSCRGFSCTLSRPVLFYFSAGLVWHPMFLVYLFFLHSVAVALFRWVVQTFPCRVPRACPPSHPCCRPPQITPRRVVQWRSHRCRQCGTTPRYHRCPLSSPSLSQPTQRRRPRRRPSPHLFGLHRNGARHARPRSLFRRSTLTPGWISTG